MRKLQQHWATLKTAATPLPLVITKPALVKIWLVDFSRKRLILFSLLLLVILLAGPFSQWVVDYLYPLDRNSFSTTIKDLFNSPSLRSLEDLRATRYLQFLSAIGLLALISVGVVLILDLPKAIRKGEIKASEYLQQSKTLLLNNPQLSETLVNQANQLLLKPESLSPALDESNDSKPEPGPSLDRTAKLPPKKKPARFVGPNQRYRIEKALASGGAGIVYEAMDTVLERRVAIKELFEEKSSDPEQTERFKVEAKALAQLNHRHILPVYDLVQEQGRFWLVMELLKGGTLGDKIGKDGILDIQESIDIIKGIAAALDIAHENGFIHRDIKPANILFTSDGGFRITDFGIAKSNNSVIKTQHGLVLGSPGYMSPEQASGEETDPRSDIYSLGITLYQMLTGKLPFEGRTRDVMAQHITQKPDKPSLFNKSINQELEAVILKMLEKKPEERYQSAKALIQALNDLNNEQARL